MSRATTGNDGGRRSDASEEDFREASSELAQQGIQDPEEYSDLLTEAARITREIQTLESDRQQAKALDLEASEALEMYRTRHHELAEQRRSLATEISSDLIRVTVVPFDNTEDLEDQLTSILGIETLRRRPQGACKQD